MLKLSDFVRLLNPCSFNLVQALLDALRRGLPLRYIESTDLALAELALLLGFSNTPAFKRAFKRWTGKTPPSIAVRGVDRAAYLAAIAKGLATCDQPAHELRLAVRRGAVRGRVREGFFAKASLNVRG